MGSVPAPYVSLDEAAGDWSLSYLAVRTEDTTSGGLPASRIGWIGAVAFDVPAAGALSLAVGWQLQPGCPEPITMPPILATTGAIHG